MDAFQYHDGELFCEATRIDDIIADVGSPAYIYSRQTLESHYDKVADAFAELDPIICYSIKSCGNLHLLRLLADKGSGMDIVSGGELVRAQRAGVGMSQVVYAGVGKTEPEIAAALEAGIGWFNIESEQEFEVIAEIAQRMGVTSHAALRINPDVSDPKTHAKTTTGKKETKFGVDIDRARQVFEAHGNHPNLKLTAIHLHLGSPIYSADPYVIAINKTLALIDELRGQGYTIDTIDIGGGYAADYETGASPNYADYAEHIVPLLKDRDLQVIIEPGRTIAGNAGILVGQVQYVKTGGAKKFVIVDTGMHHQLRPTLYDAMHFVWPTKVDPSQVPPKRVESPELPGLEKVDVVGPICETGDVLAADRPLPPVQRGANLAVFTSGAYGMVMASHYNVHPKPPEILVEGGTYRVIRRRETYDDLLAAEMETEPVGA